MTSPVIRRLLGADRNALLAAINQGRTVRELSSDFDCSAQTIKKAHALLGLPINVRVGGPRIPRPHTRYRAHWPAVIEMRESGMTYQRIGQAFGITRERVRQILHAAGRPDLCGVHRAREKPQAICQQCGEAHERLWSPYCSRQCMKDFRQAAYYKRDLPKAERIAAMRQEGKRWADVAIRFGHWPVCSVVQWMTKFCKRHDRPDLLDQVNGFYVISEGYTRKQRPPKRKTA